MERSRKSAAAIIMVQLVLSGSAILFLQYTDVSGAENWSYHTSYEICDLLENWTMEDTSVSYYTTAGKMLETRETEGGREVPILIMGDRDDVDRPWVMFIGAHHGDEPDSAEAVMGFTRFLFDGLENDDPVITGLLGSINMAILPVVNPYGLDVGSRFDENGEDPNRDYPFSPEGINTNSDGIPLTTVGAHAVHTLASMYPFTLAISFHTGSEGIFTPWGATGVGKISPDGYMFQDLGKVLSKASGHDLRYGTANEFGHLGYLNGAFDDHLYGSTFYGHLVDSRSHMLPWSTATATVEMILSKGQVPSNLGNLQGVNDIGGPDDGTVPMGTRICLAACELVDPGIDQEWIDDDTQKVRIMGAATVPDLEGTLEQNGTVMAPQVTQGEHHPYLPEYSYEVHWNDPDPEMTSVYGLNAALDIEWNEIHPLADPGIAPVSLMSLSRSGIAGRIGWSRMVEAERSDADDPGSEYQLPGITITGIYPREQEVGVPTLLTLEVPEELGIVQNITITAGTEDSMETTYIGEDLLGDEDRTYEFFTPLIEGDMEVEVNLISEHGSYIASDEMKLYPRIFIANMIREPNHPAPDNDVFRAIIGIDGGTGDTTFFYGISREPDAAWNGVGWLVAPTGIISNEFGPHTLNLDLNHLGGKVYIRACHHPGGNEDSYELDLSSKLEVSGFEVKAEGDRIIIGPGFLILDRDGLELLDGNEQDLSVGYDLLDRDGSKLGTYQMTWLGRSSFNSSNLNHLVREASGLSISPEKITGAWYATRSIPSETEYPVVRLNITGFLSIDRISNPMEVRIDRELGSWEIEEKEGEEKESGPPWGLVIFFVILALFILLLSYIRRDAHTMKEEDEENQEKEHRKRPRRPTMEKERTDRDRNTIRRAPPPPWG